MEYHNKINKNRNNDDQEERRWKGSIKDKWRQRSDA